MNYHIYRKQGKRWIYELSTNDFTKALNHAVLMGDGKYMITTPTERKFSFTLKEEKNV